MDGGERSSVLELLSLARTCNSADSGTNTEEDGVAEDILSAWHFEFYESLHWKGSW